MRNGTWAVLGAIAVMACGGAGDKPADAAATPAETPAAGAIGAAKGVAKAAEARQGAMAAEEAGKGKGDAMEKSGAKGGAAVSLAPNTLFEVAATDTLTSATRKAGDLWTAAVAEDVADAGGKVVLPAGSVVTFSITSISWSENKGDRDPLKHLELAAQRVEIAGKSYPISAKVDRIDATWKGRGGTLGDVSKVAAGAAIGAVAGKVVAGDKGAVVGGVAGAAVGTQRAIVTKDADLVIPPGNRVRLVTTAAFTR